MEKKGSNFNFEKLQKSLKCESHEKLKDNVLYLAK